MIQHKTSILEYVTGSFLVSTRQMPDPRFAKLVVYICSHTGEGAMGVVINKPNPILTMADVFKGTNLPTPETALPAVYSGGPVDPESAFILYDAAYKTENQLEITPTVSLSRETKVLEDIAFGRGPERYLFLLGYTGWAPGQLESELREDGWLIVPASNEILFDMDDQEKWQAAAGQLGIDIVTFGDIVGSS